eukprot:6491001-Amphidinium_carterae.2
MLQMCYTLDGICRFVVLAVLVVAAVAVEFDVVCFSVRGVDELLVWSFRCMMCGLLGFDGEATGRRMCGCGAGDDVVDLDVVDVSAFVLLFVAECERRHPCRDCFLDMVHAWR